MFDYNLQNNYYLLVLLRININNVVCFTVRLMKFAGQTPPSLDQVRAKTDDYTIN